MTNNVFFLTINWCSNNVFFFLLIFNISSNMFPSSPTHPLMILSLLYIFFWFFAFPHYHLVYISSLFQNTLFTSQLIGPPHFSPILPLGLGVVTYDRRPMTYDYEEFYCFDPILFDFICSNLISSSSYIAKMSLMVINVINGHKCH